MASRRPGMIDKNAVFPIPKMSTPVGMNINSADVSDAAVKKPSSLHKASLYPHITETHTAQLAKFNVPTVRKGVGGIPDDPCVEIGCCPSSVPDRAVLIRALARESGVALSSVAITRMSIAWERRCACQIRPPAPPPPPPPPPPQPEENETGGDDGPAFLCEQDLKQLDTLYRAAGKTRVLHAVALGMVHADRHGLPESHAFGFAAIGMRETGNRLIRKIAARKQDIPCPYAQPLGIEPVFVDTPTGTKRARWQKEASAIPALAEIIVRHGLGKVEGDFHFFTALASEPFGAGEQPIHYAFRDMLELCMANPDDLDLIHAFAMCWSIGPTQTRLLGFGLEPPFITSWPGRPFGLAAVKAAYYSSPDEFQTSVPYIWLCPSPSMDASLFTEHAGLLTCQTGNYDSAINYFGEGQPSPVSYSANFKSVVFTWSTK